MDIFYDSNGKIIVLSSSNSPKEIIDNTIYDTNFIYLDDNEYSYLQNNMLNYIIQDGVPVYTPVQDSKVILEEQKSKIEEINIACNLDILNGFSSTCTGVEHQYKFDMEYQNNINQQASILNLDQTIELVYWPTKDAGVVEHTREQFINLLKDANNFKSEELYRYFTMKADILAMISLEQVRQVVW